VPVIVPKVPVKFFQGTKKSAAFIPVEVGLCRHFSEKCHQLYFQALPKMPLLTISRTFKDVVESFCRHFLNMPQNLFARTFPKMQQNLFASTFPKMLFAGTFLKMPRYFFASTFPEMPPITFSGFQF
jgi:hypothetical protein